ncbi:immunoglobulin lambda-1 light chain-like isoform 1-T1 [Polymixia lowei]
MLGTLCAVITALTYVSCHKEVTQTPSIISVNEQQTATFYCDITKNEGYYVHWYKQVPGGVPAYILRFYYSHSSPDQYGSGFTSERFTSKAQSTNYQLIINNVEETDSAVYYCETWDNSVNENVFGQGTKLIVTGSTLPAPVLTIYPPSSNELKSNKATLVCLVSQMSMGFADVIWMASGIPVTSGVSTSTAVQQPDKSFQISSYLAIETSDWNQDKVYTCKVSVGSSVSEKIIKKSDCGTEE